MNRDLHPIPLSEVLPLGQRGQRVITMGKGQWDALLASAYEAGWVLLELNDDEEPVRAYRKGLPSSLPARNPKGNTHE
jgi:hypothetical protein